MTEKEKLFIMEVNDRARVRPATPAERVEYDLAEDANVIHVTRTDGTSEIYPPGWGFVARQRWIAEADEVAAI
jgi:hypothetical protein